MAEFKNIAHFKGVPKPVLIGAIEAISEVLVADAKANYEGVPGFVADTKIEQETGRVLTTIKFGLYNYFFDWALKQESDGYEVTFVSKTGNHWYEFFFDMGTKLKGLTETQWSALVNFGIGFVTADYYLRADQQFDKAHIAQAKTQMTKKPVPVQQTPKQ